MDYRKIETGYKALASTRRLAIVRYLKKEPGVTVGEIASHIRLSLKSTSKHLQILKAARCVEGEQFHSFKKYYLVGNNVFVKHFLSMEPFARKGK